MHVTIVMAAHNEERRIGAALESVVSQSYQDWDIIVVDDASTDSTPEILREWAAKEQRISVVWNAHNCGLAASLNMAWRQARGELIARMDADDISLPGRLALQANFMLAHPEIAVLGGAVRLLGSSGEDLGVAYRPERHEILARRILRENPFFHPSVMMRKSFLIEMGGYDDKLRRSQDLDLWLRSYRRFRFHNLRVPLIFYQTKSRLSLEAIRCGIYVLARNAWREGRFFLGAFYSFRFLTATMLAKIGLRSSRARSNEPR